MDRMNIITKDTKGCGQFSSNNNLFMIPGLLELRKLRGTVQRD